MKHDGLRKLERNAELVAMRDKNPDMSWQEIGDHFHISRQCAQAIYKRAKESK